MATYCFVRSRSVGFKSSLLAAAFLSVLGPLPAGGAAVCDPQLLTQALKLDPHWRYELRGDRCEGVYARKDAAFPLVVVSMTASLEGFEPGGERELVVAWRGELEAPMRLVAVAIGGPYHYRMDAVVPSGGSEFRWPTDVVASLKLSREQIALTGSTEREVSGRPLRVLLPLSVGRATPPVYDVVVENNQHLDRLEVRLERLLPTGGLAMASDRPLQRAGHPAGVPIRFQIGAERGLTEPGIYRLSLVGKRKERSDVSAPAVYFEHVDARREPGP